MSSSAHDLGVPTRRCKHCVRSHSAASLDDPASSVHPRPNMASIRSAQPGAASAGPSGSIFASPVGRLGLALGVGLAAAAVPIIRRLIVGPTRAEPPKPVKKPHPVHFGKSKVQDVGDYELAMDPPQVLIDEYYWMRDDNRKRPDVLNHLHEENAYTNYKTLPLRALKRRVYNEMLWHTQETDSSAPYRYGGYEYYTRTVAGISYVYHCRRPIVEGVVGKEQILLDENEVARGMSHCDVSCVEVSPDHTIVAYAVDFSGDERYDIHFVHIESGRRLTDDTIMNTDGTIEWGKDNSVVFYGTLDDAHRSNKVWRHRMRSREAQTDGTSGQVADSVDDLCLFAENDDLFSLYAEKSLSCRFLFLISSASTMSEVRYIDLDSNWESSGVVSMSVVAEREADVLYSVTHAGGNKFYIVTNRGGATNFKVVQCDVGSSGTAWEDFMPYNNERTISNIVAFEKFVVFTGREGGFARVWVLPNHRAEKIYTVEFPEEASTVSLGANFEFATDTFNVEFSSMKTPSQSWEVSMDGSNRRLVKQKPVPHYAPDRYETERIEATSADGTKIPISLVWNRDAVAAGGAPNMLHLYGYGSYQIACDPRFNPNNLPLLDRGVVFAIAHIRGGGEGGRVWYEQARFETKMKTFEDFIACAELLVDSGRTSKDKLSMEGRSAGGLLVGAVMNLRPDLFRAVLAGVPFVDVLNTMSDATIPLTTGEWLEWGNPHQEKYFKAMKDYCPYSNIAEQPYPAVMAVAGLNDPRVLYSEPTKWVAKLRDHTTSGRDILLKVDMNSGHFSASDRYHYKRERAFELSWLLSQLGASPTKVV